MSPLSAAPNLPSRPTGATWADTLGPSQQLENLIFTEFKQLLLSHRFHSVTPQSYRRRLISAFESPFNAHNVNSFCSRNNVSHSIVSATLEKLVDKLVSNKAKKSGLNFAPIQPWGGSRLSNQDNYGEYRDCAPEYIDSDEEMPDASPLKNLVAPVEPVQGQNIVFGVPSLPMVTHSTLPKMPTVIQNLVTNVKTPQQDGIPKFEGSKRTDDANAPMKQEYVAIPSYSPLPILIGGTGVSIASGPLFGPESPAGNKSIRAIFKERMKLQKLIEASSPETKLAAKISQPSIIKKKRKGKKEKERDKREREREKQNFEDTKNPTDLEPLLVVNLTLKPEDTMKGDPKIPTTASKKTLRKVTNKGDITGTTKDKPILITSSPPSPIPTAISTPKAAQPTTTSKELNPTSAKKNLQTVEKAALGLASNSKQQSILPRISGDIKMSCAIDAVIQGNFPSIELIYLPYPIQFTILTETQFVLECVCHSFAEKWIPSLTSNPQFLYPESAELSLWVRTIMSAHIFPTIPNEAFDIPFLRRVDKNTDTETFLRQCVRDLVALRNRTVHRHNMDDRDLGRLLDAALNLSMFLKNPTETIYLQRICDKKKELVRTLERKLRDIRWDMKIELESLYSRSHNPQNWADPAIDKGAERKREAMKSLTLSLDDLRALRPNDGEVYRSEKTDTLEDVPMDISDGSEQ